MWVEYVGVGVFGCVEYVHMYVSGLVCEWCVCEGVSENGCQLA